MTDLKTNDFALEMKANEAFMRVMVGDVTLAAEIAEKQKDPAKLQKVVDHLRKLNEPYFAIKMAQHGVTDPAEIEVLKSSLKISLPDNMSRIELAATEFAELLASERIEKRNETGFDDCNKHCGQAARIVANAVSDALSVDSMR